MSRLLRPALLGLGALLAACTSDPSETVASAAPDADAFADACQQAANWDRAMCECAADLADAELSDRARRFVAATLRDDAAEAERLRSALSFEEATQAGLFMVRAGRECAPAAATLAAPTDALASR